MKRQIPKREFWNRQRVFLTGHTGFKGSWLTLWLQAMGAEVFGFSKGVPTTPSCYADFDLGKTMRELRGDIRDIETLSMAMRQFQPSVVMHFAAQPLVIESYQNPVATFADNVMGTVNVLESARGVDSIKVVLNVTTDKVYSNDEKATAFSERDALGGSDPYSASKACSEIVTRSFAESFLLPEGKSVITCRAGNVIGGGDWGANRLLPDAARAWLSQEPLVLRHADYVRPWQHVIDCLRGYLLAVEHAASHGAGFFRSWNLGPSAGDLATVREVVDEFARAMGKRLGHKVAWSSRTSALAPKEAGTLLLDSSRAFIDLGWEPALPMKDSLSLTADIYASPDQRRQKSLLQLLEWGMNERS